MDSTAADTTPLFGDKNQTQTTPSQSADGTPLYQDRSQSPTNRLMQFAFTCIVVIMVLISVILTIYKTATMKEGALYFMLGLSLVAFVSLELFMVHFLRVGDLPTGKAWFVYIVGAGVLLECIFTDILLYQ